MANTEKVVTFLWFVCHKKNGCCWSYSKSASSLNTKLTYSAYVHSQLQNVSLDARKKKKVSKIHSNTMLEIEIYVVFPPFCLHYFHFIWLSLARREIKYTHTHRLDPGIWVSVSSSLFFSRMQFDDLKYLEFYLLTWFLLLYWLRYKIYISAVAIQASRLPQFDNFSLLLFSYLMLDEI